MGRFSAVGAALCGVELRWVGSFLTVYAGACARRDWGALCGVWVGAVFCDGLRWRVRATRLGVRCAPGCLAGGLDFAVFLFVAFYAVADQDQHLAVGGATLVVGNYVEFIEHGVVYSDG